MARGYTFRLKALDPAPEWFCRDGTWFRVLSPSVKKRPRGCEEITSDLLKNLRIVRTYRRMSWVKDEGKWHGKWEWVADPHIDRNERLGGRWGMLQEKIVLYTKRIQYKEVHEDGPVQRSRHEHGLPMDIVLLVCEHALADWKRSRTQGGDLVRTLILLCRTTAQICASTLYRTITVDATKVDDFVRCMRESTSYAATHCKMLVLRDRDSKRWDACAAIAPVLSCLRHADTLRLQLPGVPTTGLKSPFHHPRYPCVVPTLRETVSTITSLELISHSFASSLDLLRLLGSFSSLQSAQLHNASFARINGPDCGASSRWPTQLRRVSVETCSSPQDLLAALLVTWTWLRLPTDYHPIGFPGLDPCDARTVSSIYRCLWVGGGDYTSGNVFLDISHDSSGWVAWVTVPRRNLHLEFHLACSTDRLPIARVRKIVLRIWLPSVARSSVLEDYFHDPETTIPSMDKYLATLPDLDSFVFESETDTWHGLLRHEPGLLRAHLRILGSSSESLVRDTSCTAARQHASKMRHGKSQDDLHDSGLPVSPLWWYKTYQNMRPQLGTGK